MLTVLEHTYNIDYYIRIQIKIFLITYYRVVGFL